MGVKILQTYCLNQRDIFQIMKKLIISGLILGVFMGAFNYFVFAEFKEDLYGNETLLNTFIIIGMIIVSIVSFFIAKHLKKKWLSENLDH